MAGGSRRWRARAGPEAADPRTHAQQDYDTLTGAIALAARAEAEGIGGLAVTHDVVVTVTAEEVEARDGRGWAPGIMAGLPMPAIERIACTGRTRLEVVGPGGEPLHLSRTHRLFSAAQKLALVVASGGRCQYPGCRTPHPYLEAHHARWFERDQGETRIDNGILLCSYHHHLVHAKDSPIEIRAHDGDLWIVPRAWTGPPDRASTAVRGDERPPPAPPTGRRRRGGMNALPHAATLDPVIIRTPRLVLEPISPDLARRIIARDEQPGDRWHPEYPFADELAPLGSLARAGHQDPDFSLYLLRRVADGLAVGGFGFFGPPDADGTVEFGYGLVAAARGEGLATEAVVAALRFAGERGARRAAADTDLANLASQRVLVKAGLHETRRDAALVHFARDLPIDEAG